MLWSLLKHLIHLPTCYTLPFIQCTCSVVLPFRADQVKFFCSCFTAHPHQLGTLILLFKQIEVTCEALLHMDIFVNIILMVFFYNTQQIFKFQFSILEYKQSSLGGDRVGNLNSFWNNILPIESEDHNLDATLVCHVCLYRETKKTLLMWHKTLKTKIRLKLTHGTTMVLSQGWISKMCLKNEVFDQLWLTEENSLKYNDVIIVFNCTVTMKSLHFMIIYLCKLSTFSAKFDIA